jgi:hypothetical protein
VDHEFSVTVDMNKYFYRFMIIVLLTFVGVGILGSGQVQASGGSFNVPQVNDHFEKVQKGPAPEKEPSLSQEPQKEHGTWDWLTKPLKSAWNSTKETVSSAWNKTKEVCSEAWDWICNVCDQMTKVVVDGLSSAWDWIVKYKEYVAFTAVVIVGIALCLVPPLGEEILAGVALSFIISVMMNGGRIDKNTFMDAAIGGLLGPIGDGIAVGVSRALESGVGRRLVTWLVESRVFGSGLKYGGKLISKMPGPIQRMFSKAGFISGVENAGVSIVDDILHGRKINWKRALISGAVGTALLGVGVFIVPKIEPVVNKVTTAFKEYTEPILAKANRLEKCVSYQQPTQGYFASVRFPDVSCLYSPDAGGGSGTGNAGSKINGSIVKEESKTTAANQAGNQGEANEIKTLYHYTNEEGLKGILSSKKLNPSLKANNPKDARYGDGQYLSDIKPGTKRPGQLSAAFIRIPWQGRKFDHYIEIDVTGLKVVKGRENVFVIPNVVPLDISNRIVSYGKVMEKYIERLSKEAEDITK